MVRRSSSEETESGCVRRRVLHYEMASSESTSMSSRPPTSSRTPTQASSPSPELRARMGRAERNNKTHRTAGDACSSSTWSCEDESQSQGAREPRARNELTCEVGSDWGSEAEQLGKLNQLTTIAEVRQFRDDAVKRLDARMARNEVMRKKLRKVSSSARRFEAEQLANLNQLTSHAEVQQFIADTKTRMEAKMSRIRAMRKGVREAFTLMCDD
ncbi:hypothetical protein COCOBI_15-1440 [Coccomyxa sp. Obi]|nr:hypothetical protein COCOBI_15-1440 [Coccomyxa sp. Obi]